MKRILPLLFLLLPFGLRAQDTIDVIHYDLTLDVGHRAAGTLFGEARLSARLLQPAGQVRLELMRATIDSVLVDGHRVSPSYSGMRHLLIPVGQHTEGDTLALTVVYHTTGYVESAGWGGFHMDNNIHYNLGVAFGEYPHGFGRCMFPSHDSFTDKATYALHLTSPVGWTTTASGIRTSTSLNEDQSETSHWSLSHPTSTYLVSVSMGPFRYLRTTVAGYPTTVAFTTQDSARVVQAFAQLDQVVPMYERCFGPYRWGTIGYTGTPRGSMEHANNISLASFALTDLSQSGQGVMAHELAHAWFGNLVTCATSEDMWINEGGASFCEEVAAEAVHGPRYARDLYEEKLYDVLWKTHTTDGGYHAVQGLPHSLTYGSTVYDKGAMVWHSLRGSLGDSLFYASMRQLFSRCAFQNLTSLQLCDSLSAYSGRNLRDFFDFHVFSPGFADVSLDHMELTPRSQGNQQGWDICLKISQQIAGNDSLPFARLGEVPVSFFKGHRLLKDTTLTVNDSLQYCHFLLDEAPDCAIIDYHRQLSLAVTEQDTLVAERRNFEMPLAQFKFTATATPADTAFLHVGLHWCPPTDIGHPQAISRVANRYWVLSGYQPEGFVGKPAFYFSRTISDQLDRDLMPTTESLDSLRLLYREDASQPWRVVDADRIGNTSSGYLRARSLRLGQYTLAIVNDSLLASIPPTESPSLRLYPNPTNGPLNLEIHHHNLPLHLTLLDLHGRTVKEQLITHHSSLITLEGLPSGLYLLHLTDLSGKVVAVEELAVKNF